MKFVSEDGKVFEKIDECKEYESRQNAQLEKLKIARMKYMDAENKADELHKQYSKIYEEIYGKTEKDLSEELEKLGDNGPIEKLFLNFFDHDI